MSFRYSTSLVGTLKNRILLEQSRRSLAGRVFTGICNGVAVDYTASGTVLKIRFVSPEAEKRFRAPNVVADGGGEEVGGKIDVQKLQQSIRAAVFDANRQLKAAKEEGYNTSMQGNEELKADNDFRVWFEHDGGTLRPHPYEALHDEESTEYVRAARAERASDPITVASTDRTLRPALMDIDSSPVAIIRTQKRHMALEEQSFWRRVELVRKGQLATVPRGTKRRYSFERPDGQSASSDGVLGNNVSLKFVT
jgi:hypothetical protein